MSLAKKILQSDALQIILCWIAAFYVRIVFFTGSWGDIRREIPEKYWQEGKPFILALWHGRLLLQTKCWHSPHKFHMLISSHRDGRIIARTIGHLGLDSIAGSSSKGGAQALRQMVKALKRGEYVGITPDGPRGPRMRASMGVINLAKISGCPIIPVGCSSSWRKVARSWDRFNVPLPFTKGVFTWGQPLIVDRKATADELEAARLGLESRLTVLTGEADQYCGVPTVEPAEALPEGQNS
ncbi:MAG: lysophospholipid acyltransferase family protein [Rhodospirillales bacterium]|nr:lysophospholipid acyltransferase family protein [Rhodospirillales bacterium]